MDQMNEDCRCQCSSGCCRRGFGGWICVVMGLAIGAVVGWLIGQRRDRIADCVRERLHACDGRTSARPREPEELVLERPTSVRVAQPAVDSETVVTDDLALIQGIGSVFAAKLSEAGIRSFTQLANATEEQLAAAIGAEKWRQPDFAGWIRQAAERSS